MMNKNDKKYIYNYKQAYFYIQNGVLPIEQPQIHKKTHKIFFVFSTKETEEVYSKWCDRMKKIKKNKLN